MAQSGQYRGTCFGGCYKFYNISVKCIKMVALKYIILDLRKVIGFCHSCVLVRQKMLHFAKMEMSSKARKNRVCTYWCVRPILVSSIGWSLIHYFHWIFHKKCMVLFSKKNKCLNNSTL